MESMDLNSSQKLSEEETFDFPSLPWVCQRRFAEICDGQSLKTFASINSFTRKLTKRCHTINDVLIDATFCSRCTYTILCYCKENEFCNGVDFSSFKDKIPAGCRTRIINGAKDSKTDTAFLESLPINLNSIENLFIHVYQINLEDLKKLITPELKSLDFIGGIKSDCSLKQFVEFIQNLSKLDFVRFSMNDSYNSLPFSSDDWLQQISNFPNFSIWKGKYIKNCGFRNFQN